MAAEYQQMRDMLVREEREAMSVVDRELDSGQTKVRDLMKKFNENIEEMSKAKEDINNLMVQSQTAAFLQVRRPSSRIDREVLIIDIGWFGLH